MVSVAVVGSESGGPAAPPPPGRGRGMVPSGLYARVVMAPGRVEPDIWEIPGLAVHERMEGPAGLARLGQACVSSPPKPQGRAASGLAWRLFPSRARARRPHWRPAKL